jgi:acyl carrier protein
MDDDKILACLTDIFRHVFEYDGDPLTKGMTSDDIRGWDSMSNITLALEIERAFHIKIKMADMERLKSVKNLVTLVGSNLKLSTP